MKKMFCRSCGVVIMPVTHTKNDGQCMPCFHEQRAAMEAERVRRAEREADPFVQLFSNLRDRVCAAGSVRDAHLSPDELIFYSVSAMLSDLHRGAYHLYFDVSSMEEQQAAERGLQHLDEPAILAEVREAKHLWEQDEVWIKQHVDEEDAVSPYEKQLEDLTSSAISRADGLLRKLEKFAIDNKLVAL